MLLSFININSVINSYDKIVSFFLFFLRDYYQ